LDGNARGFFLLKTAREAPAVPNFIKLTKKKTKRTPVQGPRRPKKSGKKRKRRTK
jgi:hypothetical protein